MKIIKGQNFYEEFNFVDENKKKTSVPGERVFVYLTYGLDVEKIELTFDGSKAVLSLSPMSTSSISYKKLFYSLVLESQGKEYKIQEGVIEVE